MEQDKKFLSEYFDTYSEALKGKDIFEKIVAFKKMVESCSGKLIFAGNGASASISSHCALDYTKQGGVRSECFSSDAFITAFVNDFGYDHWLAKAMEHHADADDIVILISSSGKSPNVVNAAKYCRSRGMRVVTLTGFADDNPLKQLGDLNLWIDSKSYNIIECTHMFWLMAACDLLIGKAEYPVS